MLDPAQLGLQVVARFSGKPPRQVMIFGQQFCLRSESPCDLVEDRAVKILRHLLGKHGGPHALLADDLAPVGLQDPLQKAEERRLAAAVAAQEAYPFARLNRQIGLVQDQRTAKGQVDLG